jgi:DNA-binding XRE family transcriptional regulator
VDKGNGRKPAPGSGMPFQDPHGHGEAQGKLLEQAIGRAVKDFREKLGLTIAELAKAAEMSAGMLSKIENGATSPSLASLQALGKALQVPVTAFFKS